MTDTEIRDDRSQGRLEAVRDGEEVGVIAYFVLDATPPALVAVHTVVDERYQGQGIAGELVRHVYRMAAAEDMPVVPLCSYAATWAQRHPGEAPAAPAGLVTAAQDQLQADPHRW